MMDDMANEERAPAGFGCLSMIIGVLVLAAIVVLVLFVGFVALGIFAALLVIGLVVLAVDRVLLAVSPKRRQRRARQSGVFVWRFGQVSSGGVIDTTAIDTTESSDDRSPEDQGPDALRPE
jgi:hypothetical protein